MTENRVKTKKVHKKRLKLRGVLLLACFIGAILLVIFSVSKVKISGVEVTGSKNLKDSEIIKEANLNDVELLFGFSAKKSCKSLLENAFVKSCKIQRTVARKVKIEIEENSPLFFYSSENSMVLSNGKRIGTSNAYGVSTLINMVPEEILNDFIVGLSKIDSDIIRSISEIKYAPSTSKEGVYIDEELFVFMMNDGNTVYINNRRLENMNYYKDIYASIGDKLGTYYFDCDYDNIVFREYGTTNVIEPGE